MAFNESTIIDQIASHERSIVGIRNSYGFSQNPDVLTLAMLPAVIHYSPSTTATPRAHHNVWANTLRIKSILLAIPRQGAGGKLKFLEGATVPYAQLWRDKFQTDAVITDILASTGSIKCWWAGGAYGAGGLYLEYAGTPYCGWVFDFNFVSA
jgi:hypothetical protein